MSILYQKLNLPENPLVDTITLDQLPVNPPGAGQLQPTIDVSLLNQPTLDAFASIGLTPLRIFVFGNKSFPDTDPDFEVRCGAHRDMHWVNGKWEYEIFAVNYELTQDRLTLAWKFWDIRANPIYPDTPTSEHAKWLGGQHFHAKQRGSVPNFGDPNDYTVIDQFVLDRPTLCRVDVPHSVHHTNAHQQRYGLTIRFDHKFKSWEDVLTVFEPLAVK